MIDLYKGMLTSEFSPVCLAMVSKDMNEDCDDDDEEEEEEDDDDDDDDAPSLIANLPDDANKVEADEVVGDGWKISHAGDEGAMAIVSGFDILRKMPAS